MLSKKPLYVQDPPLYVVQMAGIPAGQAEHTSAFPDAEQLQRLFALAEEFGVRILAFPELPVGK